MLITGAWILTEPAWALRLVPRATTPIPQTASTRLRFWLETGTASWQVRSITDHHRILEHPCPLQPDPKTRLVLTARQPITRRTTLPSPRFTSGTSEFSVP